MILTPPTGVSGLPDHESLNLRCESADVPSMSDQKMEINVRGHKIFQPGIHTYTNQMTLTFVETVDAKIKTFIRTWREALWSTRTGVAAGQKNTLMGIIVLTQLNNQDVGVYEYKLIGAYPESYELGQLDGAQSDVQRPSITFSFDYFEDKALV